MAKNFSLIIVIILTFISVLPLFKSGLPPTHDGEYHVIRFYEFYKTLIDGNPYPRWAPDLNYGFGVPILNFVYPWPSYVASLLHAFGVSFIDSLKLNMIFASFVGAIFFYLWVKEFFGKLGGIVSSVFYTFSPYHFLDIYIRGSVGEVWALGLFPAFLWSITKFIKEKKNKFAIISSLALGLIILSHNILALMFLVFALFYVIFLIFQEKDRRYLIFNTLYIIFLGLGLSSVFWIPALVEKGYVRGLEVFDYAFHFPEFYELIFPSWGSGFSGGGLSSQLSFQIGIANLLAPMGSFIAFLILRRRKNESSKIIGFFLIWFMIVFVLMLKVSLPIWQSIPLLNYFQFPWRFLSLEILIVSFLAGSVVFVWKSRIIAFILVALSFSLGIGYTTVPYYHQRDDNYYVQRSNFIDGTNSPGNAFNTIWLNGISEREKEKLILEQGKIEKENIKSTSYTYSIVVPNNQRAIVNTAYFPGWSVYVDGRKARTEITNNGLFAFSVDKGKHEIFVNFEDIFIRKLAVLISFISLFLILSRVSLSATINKWR